MSRAGFRDHRGAADLRKALDVWGIDLDAVDLDSE
jgi:hypothetical protein